MRCRRCSNAFAALDGIPARRVGSPQLGAATIPERSDNHYDFDRLERAVSALSDSHEQLRGENSELLRVLRDKDQHIGRLDEKLRDANQRRQDVCKRLDDLIAQIDQLDTQFEAQEEA